MPIEWIDPPAQSDAPTLTVGGPQAARLAPPTESAPDPRLAPSTANVTYGPGAPETDQPITRGQADYAETFKPDPRFPVGSRWNPPFETATSGAPRKQDAPFYVSQTGELVVQGKDEPALDTLGALAGRVALAPLGGVVGQTVFPSERLEAAQSGATSGLLLGGKNELLGGAAGLGAKLRGGDYSSAYDEARTTADERDRYLKTAYPLSYYGGGATGATVGAALTPEIKAAQAAAPLAKIGARIGQTALDTGIGALSGALSSDPGQRTEGALAGGVGAGVLSRLTRGRISEGAPRSTGQPSPQRLLLDEGVPLTVGQITGGVAKSTEDAMTSLPLVGDLIQSSRSKGVEGLNRAAVNRTLAPIGEELPKDVKAGFDAITYADDKISSRYDDILEPLTIAPDQEFVDARMAMGAAIDELPGDVAVGIQNILRNRIDKRLEAGVIDGKTWKKIDSELAHKSRAYSRSPDPLMHDGADVIDEARVALRDLLERTNPGLADEIRDVNTSFANLVRVQRAARRAKDGVFSPEQLRNAVLSEDSSARGRAGSMNRALMQDLANAGSTVLPSGIPDSGTPRRLMLNLLGGGGLAASGTISPLPLIGAGVAAFPHLPGVRGAISGIARNAPRLADDAARIPGARAVGSGAKRLAPRISGQLAGQRR
ncbi:MAG: hypothetical protein WC130_11675 [Kiritimatiellia bacterium]